MHVLILDNDQALGQLMWQCLAKCGIDWHLVFTPEEAFAQLASQIVDVLVLDMMLPGQDGMSVCREIRQSNKPFSDIPILALTARADVTDRIVALESGFDDFVVKSAARRELVARIGAVSRRGRSSASTRRLTRTPSSSPDSQAVGFTLSETNLSASFQGVTINLTKLELQDLQASMMRVDNTLAEAISLSALAIRPRPTLLSSTRWIIGCITNSVFRA